MKMKMKFFLFYLINNININKYLIYNLRVLRIKEII